MGRRRRTSPRKWVKRDEDGGSVKLVPLDWRAGSGHWQRVEGGGVGGGRLQGGPVSAQDTQRFFRWHLPGAQARVLSASCVPWLLASSHCILCIEGDPGLKGSRAQ